MSILEAIHSNFSAIDPVAAARIQRIVNQAREAGEGHKGIVVLSVNLDLPRLERADSAIREMRTVDAHGRFNELTINFRKINDGVMRVDINGAGLTTGGAASLDIHLSQSGSILGFDTDGSGRVDSTEAPNLDLTGHGELVQLNFDDRAPGPVDYAQNSFRAGYLEILQGGGSSSDGASTIIGTSGDDQLTGTTGIADAIAGGSGSDTVDYSTDIAQVLVDIANLTAVDGSGATDSLTGIENAIGSDYDDQLTGDSADNQLSGGAGNDTIDDGGGGTDTLSGGAGSDTFVVHDTSGTVTITDFAVGPDVIDLGDVATITSYGELKAATSDDGSGNAVIDLGAGATLTLTGVAESDLSNGDFIF